MGEFFDFLKIFIDFFVGEIYRDNLQVLDVVEIFIVLLWIGRMFVKGRLSNVIICEMDGCVFGIEKDVLKLFER